MVISALNEVVKVTRKYQVTIPEKVRSELGVKIGDKLVVKSEKKRIVMEAPERVTNPSDALWNLFGKSLNVDAVSLVEESWKETCLPKMKTTRMKKQKARTT
jgi:AbrB family looped-hinge helix DNA binding protein